MKPKLIIIAGPTAVGKSQVAIELAQAIDAEVIVADSMQIYRFMDIGTAKAASREQALVPHHLLDILNPDENFSAAQFREKAAKTIDILQKKGKSIVICGGTGLYIKALVRGLFRGGTEAKEIRENLRQQEAMHGPGFLYERLKRVDPVSAYRIQPEDIFRIVRALEVYHKTGQPISEYHAQHAFQENPYDYLQVGLYRERSLLYERIDKRCEQMFAEGFIDEVKSLLRRGYHSGLRSMRSLGYRHVCVYLEGGLTLEETIAAMKRDTRRYAKRQLTWFRADPTVVWWDLSLKDFGQLKNRVKAFLSTV